MASTPASEHLTSSEFTQRTMLSDMTQQRWLIGVGIGIVVLLMMRMRQAPEQERAARRLVRDLRNIDDIGSARDLFGSEVPTILRPALLLVFEEIERQTHRFFRNLERSIERL
jgi:hypothetical protein